MFKIFLTEKNEFPCIGQRVIFEAYDETMIGTYLGRDLAVSYWDVKLASCDSLTYTFNLSTPVFWTPYTVLRKQYLKEIC